MSGTRPGVKHRTDGIVALSFFVGSDACVMCDGDHDPEHRRRFEFPDDFNPSLDHSMAVIARWEKERTDGTRFPFAVRDVATNTLLGGCELRPLAADAANLSYWTYAPHRGRGVASRAVALVREIAFGEFGIRRIEVLVDPDNWPSRQVAVRNRFREVGSREGRVLYMLEKDQLMTTR